MSIEAAPIVVAPSGKFLGNDGAWSVFSINVGDPPQALQVVPSTQQSATWVVAPGGCPSSGASNCTDARGGTFDATKSSSWFKKDMYHLNEAINLGYGSLDVNGTYGFDTLMLRGTSGVADVSIDQSVVAGIITDRFYVGSLGLAPDVINFPNSGDSSPSLLTSLKTKSMIPSLSYGYTAGASYKQDGVNASLTLGGYDTSRFTPNDVNFIFSSSPTRRFIVGLQSITYSDSRGEQSLLSEGVLALVDSTVPHLWLPQSVCKVFESVFGISWDPISNLYTINDTAHDTLMENNPSVVFELANSNGGAPSVNITLPYASFDLNATRPLVKKETRYFPLQRAADDTAHTLGRTFLQEAYMTVDYENSRFSISQSKFDANTPSHIVAIPSKNNDSSAANPTSSGLVKTSGNSSNGIGTGAIAGVAIAIALVGIIAAVTAFFCMRRRRHARKLSQLPYNLSSPNDQTKIDDSKERDSTEDLKSRKPAVGVTVAEVPMTPQFSEIGGDEYFSQGTSRQQRPELAGELVSRSELSTPDPFTRAELPSPDPQALRSELSTPEPLYPNSELPAPNMSAELPSPSVSAANSPDLGSDRSALNSPLPRLPLQRPSSMRMDSSDSEAGFTRDGMRNFRQRLPSNDSNPTATTKRPGYKRMTTDDFVESPVLGHIDPPSSIAEAAVSSPEPTLSRPAFRRSLPHSTRSQHQRLSSLDSETWETRLEMTSSDDSAPTSRFGTLRHERWSSEGTIENKPVSTKTSDKKPEHKE